MFRYCSQVFVVTLLATAVFPARQLLPHAGASAPETGPPPPSLSGVDVYESLNPDPLAGKRVGLITNQTGVDSKGIRTIDVLAGREGVKLVAIFSPEHGIEGRADAKVPDSLDTKTGVRIFSLYGDTRRPTDEMLQGVDVLVFDIQDAGVRFYTYITTMAYCMEEAAKHHIEFMVFDRPDLLGGEVVEGPMLDADRTSFTGYFPMPLRYGMTIGEVAKMFNQENKIGANLKIIAVRLWTRDEVYEETKLRWIAPSPNLRTIISAFLYPGVEILQAGGVSVGRGTDRPFEQVGAPWIQGTEFAAELERRKIPGVSFKPTKFTPADGPWKGHPCEGVRIFLSDRDTLRAMRLGLEMADALHRMYPVNFDVDKIVDLLGSKRTVEQLKHGDAPADIIGGWSGDLARFSIIRERYLLYE